MVDAVPDDQRWGAIERSADVLVELERMTSDREMGVLVFGAAPI